jgi:hypothetical protein
LISCPKNPCLTLSLPKTLANCKSNEPEPQAGSYTLLTSVFQTVVILAKSSLTS